MASGTSFLPKSYTVLVFKSFASEERVSWLMVVSEK